jgi:starch-binding outer membrane protein, SusD/RagB family
MKRLKTIYILILVIVFSFSSCNEETINIDPIGNTEAGFFQTEDQMTQAVLGIYQKISFFYTFRSSNWLSGIWTLPGDNLTTQGNHGYERFVSINGNDGKLTNFYQYSYQLIARANVILQKVEENANIAYTLEPELKDFHKGEALFLRAWMYYKLWNTYGSAAPLITERIMELDNAYPPSSQGTELLDQAITDLQEAASLLPESWDSSNKGRVTKNSARALRGKILVFRGTVNGNTDDFSDAISAFNAISGASLMPNYRDNFDAAQENNAESFFEYQANDPLSGTNPFLNNDDFSGIGDISAYYGMFTKQPEWIGSDVYSATESLINAYESGDPRLNYTIDTEGEATNVIKYTLDGSPVRGWASGYNANRNNPRILRYADVLLLKAEALVRSGGSTSEAIGLINQVRERARMSTKDGTEAAVPADLDENETNNETILDWIFKERRIELACEEGHRWYDLRRRHIAGEIDLTNWDFSSVRTDFEFKEYNIVFPIPTSEVVQNPNLSQNTNY